MLLLTRENPAFLKKDNCGVSSLQTCLDVIPALVWAPLCSSSQHHVTPLCVSECTNVSESLLSEFMLAVNHCLGQLAVATGQVGLSGWQPQSCSSEIGSLRKDHAPLLSLKSHVNWCLLSAILTDTLDYKTIWETWLGVGIKHHRYTSKPE